MYIIFAAVGIALVIAAILALSVWRDRPRRRAARLRERFGPEYDVAVEQYGASRAVRVLEARSRRVEKFQLRPLTAAECGGFTRSWHLAQEQFVDSPNEAVGAAHELVQRVMRARGYPVEDFDQNVADLSVDYGNIVQHYRAAHALDQSNRAGEADTEELRQALVHYRALFEKLLGEALEEPPPISRRLRSEPHSQRSEPHSQRSERHDLHSQR
jgi:hypothetical protein